MIRNEEILQHAQYYQHQSDNDHLRYANGLNAFIRLYIKQILCGNYGKEWINNIGIKWQLKFRCRKDQEGKQASAQTIPLMRLHVLYAFLYRLVHRRKQQ